VNSISDIIEHYLKKVLEEASEDYIEIKRSELADIFQCVPSQINYVISTRFTLEKGYMVESKRGGSGYIRIQKIPLTATQNIFQELLTTLSDATTQTTAQHIISRLFEEAFVTEREAVLMQKLVSREILGLPLPRRDEVRARMMKVFVATIFTSKGE
jgi:transcriptional regulator CtsR